MDNVTTCPGCGTMTFIGHRIRHAKGCSLAAASRAAALAARTPAQLARAAELARIDKLTQCDDPELREQLNKDFDDHDK